MRKTFAVVIAILMVAAFIGQVTAEGTAEGMTENAAGYMAGQAEKAYGYSHGGYVAEATATVLWDGSVSVDID